MSWRFGMSRVGRDPEDESQWVVVSDFTAKRPLEQDAPPVRRLHKRRDALHHQECVLKELRAAHPVGLTTLELVERAGITRTGVNIAALALMDQGVVTRTRESVPAGGMRYRYRVKG